MHINGVSGKWVERGRNWEREEGKERGRRERGRRALKTGFI